MKQLTFLFVLLVLYFSSSARNLMFSITITGSADFSSDGDTVQLKLYKDGLLSEEPSFQSIYFSKVINHKFCFSLPRNTHPQYINITFNKHGESNLLFYLVEASDNIELNFKKKEVVITGEKSKGFEAQYRIREIENNFFRTGKYPAFNPTTLEMNFLALDSVSKAEYSLLKNYKNRISSNLYEALSTQINAVFAWTDYDNLNYFSEQYLDSLKNPVMNSYNRYLKTHKPPLVTENKESWASGFYIKYLYAKYKVDSCLAKQRKFDIANCLTYFNKTYSGNLREQLFVYVLYENKDYPKSLKKIIEKELASMKNQDYRLFLTKIKEMRIDGDIAYNFKLKDVKNNNFQLNDYSGKVTVIDFWFTGCENCKELAPLMKNIEKEFIGRPVMFISVSIDKSKSQWLKSVYSGAYTSPDIKNLYTEGQGAQHSIISNYHITSYPTLILINRNGQVNSVQTDPRMDHGSRLINQIRACLR